MPSYESDPTMRDVAFTALLTRCPWFEDLKMNDTAQVVTDFLKAWRAAQYRHDTNGQTIYQWAHQWSLDHRAEYRARFRYLPDPDREEESSEVR